MNTHHQEEDIELIVKNKMITFCLLVITITFVISLLFCNILFHESIFSFKGSISALLMVPLLFGIISAILKIISICNGTYIPTDKEIELYLPKKR